MLIRALIVLLVILNVGVAAWWILSPDATSHVPTSVTPESPGLQLVSEGATTAYARRIAPPPANPIPAAGPVVPSAAVAGSVAAARCMTVGPFADASALATARSALQARVSRLVVRQAPSGRKGWRVWLPPLPDHASALAMAARIDAAGFKDYYVLPSGDDANGIALGRFGSEEAARRQQSTLQAAGFPAEAQALGATAQWLDVVTDNSDMEALRRESGAAQLRVLDCAKLAP